MNSETVKREDRAFRLPDDRKAAQLDRLRKLVNKAKAEDTYYQAAFANIDLQDFNTLDDLTRLPFLSKDDLITLQRESAPFGGLMSNNAHSADYLFSSPGPIYEPGFMTDKFWRISRAMRAAGFTKEDIVHNTLSYHLTPGAWMMDSGARNIGCTVIPAGVSALDMQIEAMVHYQPTAYSGTPDFLKRLLQSFQEIVGGPAPLQKALVSGGALTPGLREFFTSSGVEVRECYATAELGVISYETMAGQGMMVDEDVIVEIINPQTGERVEEGEVGEVVVTTLREDYPLFRFCTGDLSAFLPGASPCGRTGQRIKGWMGRSDQSTKVKGMFVRPTQIQTLLRKNPYIQKARLIVHRDNERDEMMLHCELKNDTPTSDIDSLQENISAAFKVICHLNSKVSIVPSGAIPDDGKVIVDLREI